MSTGNITKRIHILSKLNFLLQIWSCEFCGSGNEVDTSPEEVTSESDVTYMLQPASLNTDIKPEESQKSLVIFCLDNSGSMDASVQVGYLNFYMEVVFI